MKINCRQWQDNAAEGFGTCLGRKNGAHPSYGVCERCDDREPIDPAAPAYPSITQQAVNAVQAVGRVVKAAVKRDPITVSEAVYQARLEICTQCDKLDGQQFRCRQCGCYTKAKLRLATESCPLDKWADVDCLAGKWPGAGPEVVINGTSWMTGRIGAALAGAVKGLGMRPCLITSDRMQQQSLAAENLITWGYRLPQGRYTEQGRNVLFVDNGLLGQLTGARMDSEGYFSDSAMVRYRDWLRQPSVDELARMREHARRATGFDVGNGGDPDGPVLLALQCPDDAALRFYDPDCPAGADSIEHTLRRVRDEYRGDGEIIVRPHPRHLDHWQTNLPRYAPILGDWQTSTDGSVYRLVGRCRGLITVNSTLAVEAVAMGIPVATLGRGPFSGAGVTWECAGDPRRLAAWDPIVPTTSQRDGFLCSVLRHEIPWTATADEVASHPEFQRWAGMAVADDRVTVITTVYAPDARRESITMGTLVSLAEHVPFARRILAIDVATDEFESRALALGFECVRINGGEAPRMASLLGLAVGMTATRLLLTVDSDVVINAGTVPGLLAMAKARTDAVAIQAVCCDSAGRVCYPSSDRITVDQFERGETADNGWYPTFSATLWQATALRHVDWAALPSLMLADQKLWPMVKRAMPKARALTIPNSTVFHHCRAIRTGA